jgi:hypothetical protein
LDLKAKGLEHGFWRWEGEMDASHWQDQGLGLGEHALGCVPRWVGSSSALGLNYTPEDKLRQWL